MLPPIRPKRPRDIDELEIAVADNRGQQQARGRERLVARERARTPRYESSRDVPSDVEPPAESFRHRRYILVAHLLERVGRERRAISARAVDDDLFVTRNRRLDEL